jgi:hypothetical protein
MNSSSTNRVKVESSGTGVAAHVGLHALGQLADHLELGALLSARVAPTGERLPLHQRGKVITQLALVLAGGGDSCADIEHLRIQEELFSSVPSDTTVFRTMHEFDAAQRSELMLGVGEVRAKVWKKLDTDPTKPVILDFDASLVEVESENKQQAAPTYKGGYGFHPIFVFCDLTGETLAAKLRPGNAGANTVADHVEVFDAALAQLPANVAVGHHVGDDPALDVRQVIARADGAGCTDGFMKACRQRNVQFSVTVRSNAQLSSAIVRVSTNKRVWRRALTQKGERRPGAEVTEVTDLLDLSGLPEGTRCVIRREPLHPGAQRSLFPSLDYRYWGFYTDCEGTPVALDQQMRAHAHVEQHIQRLKESGLCSMPFTNFEANATWLVTIALASDLVRWFQLLCLSGEWRNVRPKRLRWEIWHAPGRLVYSARQVVVRLLDGWPGADQLLHAYKNIAALS